MEQWVKCFYFDKNRPSGVFPVETMTRDTVTVVYDGKAYNIPIEHTRIINVPEYNYGDSVSPKNHLEMKGTICGIDYHWNRDEPMYFIKVNGKIKSKRYFKDDLVHIV